MKRMIRLAATAIAVLLLASCSASKKVPYLVDAEQIPTEVLSQAPIVNDPVITAGDLLNIEVTSPNMTAVAPFNKGRYVDDEGKIHVLTRQSTSYTNTGLEVSTDYYLVNADGNIEFPIIGPLHVAGLTKNQVAEVVVNAIYPHYVTERPNVDIRLMNFRVSVAGAVKNPGVYQSRNERMTFLEAISMAGDLTIYGNRNITVIREEDGKRTKYLVDLKDDNLFNSPVFYIKQNDVIYVEPNGVKAGQASVNENPLKSVSMWMSIATFLMSIGLIIFK